MPNPNFVGSQLHAKIPYPTKKWTGQTIIVTGSNVGMGLEAARHFVRLDAAKVILAVRNLSKGEAAKASIEASEKRLNVVDVWELDLAKYASVKAFAARAQKLERLDVVIENAGIYTFEFNQAEENEATITVNVVSTFLLALLLIPKLRETAVKFEKVPVLTFTGSFVHFDTKFPERKEANIFEGLAKEKGARMNDRYVLPTILISNFG
jgi:retinol dehydrogenase-12